MTRRFRVACASIIGIAFVGLLSPVAYAVAPTNDNLANATGIASIPFTDTVDTTDATVELDENELASRAFGATVWYSYTPTETQTLDANSFGSDFDTVVTVWEQTGAGFSGLELINKNDDAEGSFQSQVLFNADASVTYLFQAGGCCGPDSPATGSLTFNLDVSSVVPFTVEGITLDEATVDPRTGVASVTFTVTCSGEPGRISVELFSLQQPGVRTGVIGLGQTEATCDETVTVVVSGRPFEPPTEEGEEFTFGRYHPGKATITYGACPQEGSITCVVVEDEAIRLRRR